VTHDLLLIFTVT